MRESILDRKAHRTAVAIVLPGRPHHTNSLRGRSMRTLVFSSVVIVGVAVSGAALAALHTYKTEAAARKHCPSDTVVWENTATHVYRLPHEGHEELRHYEGRPVRVPAGGGRRRAEAG